MTSREAMLFMKNEHNVKCKGSFKDSQRKCEYSEMNHIRYFIKTPFINKGIDIIDLPSILRDYTVESPIPDYFENKEPSIICYKYIINLLEVQYSISINWLLILILILRLQIHEIVKIQNYVMNQ